VVLAQEVHVDLTKTRSCFNVYANRIIQIFEWDISILKANYIKMELNLASIRWSIPQ